MMKRIQTSSGFKGLSKVAKETEKTIENLNKAKRHEGGIFMKLSLVSSITGVVDLQCLNILLC